MTIRQRIMKLLYPVIMKLGGLSGANGRISSNQQQAAPVQPFHQLTATRNNGSPFPFEALRGKKVLLVNTASDCGFTAQYDGLQALQDQYGEQLVVLSFPANDFQNQETGDDAAIASFCSINYNIKFPIMQKCQVIKGANQHPVYQWLTNAQLNGWNNEAPAWNFSKYLVNEEGWLTHHFGTAIAPNHPAIIKAIESTH